MELGVGEFLLLLYMFEVEDRDTITSVREEEKCFNRLIQTLLYYHHVFASCV